LAINPCPVIQAARPSPFGEDAAVLQYSCREENKPGQYEKWTCGGNPDKDSKASTLEEEPHRERRLEVLRWDVGPLPRELETRRPVFQTPFCDTRINRSLIYRPIDRLSRTLDVGGIRESVNREVSMASQIN
jgi:hypothetical protein